MFFVVSSVWFLLPGVFCGVSTVWCLIVLNHELKLECNLLCLLTKIALLIVTYTIIVHLYRPVTCKNNDKVTWALLFDTRLPKMQIPPRQI